MGLLDNTTHQQYYQGSDFGNYQFTSLQDIINQFMIAYVGEDKIISKVQRGDVQFHAMRALQELSFDTFKSIKAQQIDIPATLVMPLPHDYVNYTRVMWTDSAGIKHPLYPTRDTQNPFQIAQDEDGAYTFVSENEEIINGDFSDTNINDTWTKWSQGNGGKWKIKNSGFEFKSQGADPFGWNAVMHQEIDVSDKTIISLSADGLAVDIQDAGSNNAPGTLRIGLATSADVNTILKNDPSDSNANSSSVVHIASNLFDISDTNGDLAFLEWTVSADGTTSTTKEIGSIDVTSENEIYVIVMAFHDFSNTTTAIASFTDSCVMDNISVIADNVNTSLVSPAGNEFESSTWKNYKSHNPSENNLNDYQDYQNDIFWPNEGKRYGLDPKHAQVNGSFYIDQRLGKIHFSSNVSGKTVVLDYISDSLGTDEEMQVHKFAEEAMYKWIMHAVLSTRINVPEYQVRRLKKERFAAIRQAKLRLSNIKLEELTQILRGKSKQIKH